MAQKGRMSANWSEADRRERVYVHPCKFVSEPRFFKFLDGKAHRPPWNDNTNIIASRQRVEVAPPRRPSSSKIAPPKVVNDTSLQQALFKCQRAVKFSIIRVSKALAAVEMEHTTAGALSVEAAQYLAQNKSIDGKDRDAHQPRAEMKFDYVANLVDMMDQVEVEASYADTALATHVNKMRVISAALEACASLLALRKQAHDEKVKASGGRQPIGQPAHSRSGGGGDAFQTAVQHDMSKAYLLVEEARVACQDALNAINTSSTQCNSAKRLMESANFERKLLNAPHGAGAPHRVLELSWSDDLSYAMKWVVVGRRRPKHGTLLPSAKLAAALALGIRDFTLDDLKLFGVAGQVKRYHYVRGEGMYYRPAVWEDPPDVAAVEADAAGTEAAVVEETAAEVTTPTSPLRERAIPVKAVSPQAAAAATPQARQGGGGRPRYSVTGEDLQAEGFHPGTLSYPWGLDLSEEGGEPPVVVRTKRKGVVAVSV